MPIETDILPFFDWLLGPGWADGVLFRAGIFAPVLVVLAATACGLFFLLRRGSERAPRIVGRLLAAGVLLSSLLVVGGFGVHALLAWLADADTAAPTWRTLWLTKYNVSLNSLLHASQWLLGEQWYAGGLYFWLLSATVVLLAFLVVGWLVGTMRCGPRRATRNVDDALADLLVDVARMSPRRVLALGGLAVKEAIRRRVVIVFGVFLLIMLFAGWFLDPRSTSPARLYLEFVLTTTMYLMLLLALFISALSLPRDLKERTLHTVVTKPVRKSEIVLGRIVGFTAIGTLLLIGMIAISYVFVVRGLAHTHQLTAADLHRVEGSDPQQPSGWKGQTSKEHGHWHEVYIDPAGHGRVETQNDHWHELTVTGSGDRAVYTLGPPQGMLVARVPRYGKLHFKDNAGRDVEKGVNVGDEWAYRSFIAGGTRAAAIWSFSGVSAAEFPEGIPLELTIEVFRTYKGDLKRGILGSLWVRNPQSGDKAEVRIFQAKKFTTDVQFIPATFPDIQDSRKARKIDLFKDMVSEDGKLEVWLQCLEGQQYFGAAQADVFLRAGNASFPLNFAKGYLGIWLQMVLVIAIGTMFSTFLSGPVAFIGTMGAIVGGVFSGFMHDLAMGAVIGGGPVEASIRILKQQNLVTELEPGLMKNVAIISDRFFEWILGAMSALLPPFADFSYASNVAYGFDINGDLLLTGMIRAVGYLLPLFVAGYLFLKLREVGR